MGWRVACAGGSPVSGVDRMTGAGVAGDVETGDGEAAPLHPQSNIADSTQIPESKRRFLRTVAVIKDIGCLLSAVHRSPLMLGSGTERPSRTALGGATFVLLHQIALKEAGSRDDSWIMVEPRDLNLVGNQILLPGGSCLLRQ